MDAPLESQCQGRKPLTRTKGDQILQIVRIGVDIAKKVFQVHGVDKHGKVIVRKQPSRSKVLSFFAQLPACLVGLEACGSAAATIAPSALARRRRA